MKKLLGTISVDIDTMQSIFKGRLRYCGDEFQEGLENLSQFLDMYKVTATLFCVGNDLRFKKNQSLLKQLNKKGYEVANHTMTHAQGLRWLSRKEKKKEIVDCNQMCTKLTGKKPIGFRAPGWNIDEEVLEILVGQGYQYDSSIFPTFLMPATKLIHYLLMWKRKKEERTTMGKISYILCPPVPYRTKMNSFSKGSDGLWEFPISVTPKLRLPLSATTLLLGGFPLFKKMINSIKQNHMPLQFMMHLFDFVDFSRVKYKQQINNLAGSYVAQSIHYPYQKKIDLWKRAFDLMVKDYKFLPFKERCQLL